MLRAGREFHLSNLRYCFITYIPSLLGATPRRDDYQQKGTWWTQLALIKGNPNDFASGSGNTQQRRSALIKTGAPSGDATSGESTALFTRSALTKGPQPTPEQQAEFQQRQLLANSPSPVLGKVFGRQNDSRIDSALPKLTTQVHIRTGDEPPEDKKAPPPITVDQAIIDEAKQKAAALLQAAQKKANDALTAAAQKIQQFQELAKTKAEEANKAAYAQGLEQGRIDGRQQGHDEYLDLMLKARDLYLQAIRERDKLIDNTEPELARLAVGIAERIIGQEVAAHGEFIMSVVRDAMADCKDREQVIIRVAPDDYHLVNNDRATFARMVEGLKDFDLVIDSKVSAGGCIIETNLGNIDARLNTQIAAIKAAFDNLCHIKESDAINASPSANPE